MTLEKENFLSEGQNLRDYLEREALRALQGERINGQEIGREEILIWLYTKPIVNLNHNKWSYHWASQAQMENLRILKELAMKSRLYQESHAKDCFGIEELQRICFEETERARQLRTDGLNAQKKDEPSPVNQFLSQIQYLQGECLERRERILRSGDSEQLWNVPRSQSTLENSEPWRYAWPRFWIAAPYTELDGYFRKRAQESICPSLPGTVMRQGEGTRREPQSSTIPTPRFTRNHDTWNSIHRSGGSYSHNCTMETPRFAVSELHFGKFRGL